ncbi:MAG: hypothetical protein JNM94_13360 [Phycisphaerae bacterium]|nr:hypothetical protein [Phycisphaerae bacterium]
MLIPDHWAEARRQFRTAKRQVTVRRFGWSMSSPDDASAMAERRAEEALGRIIAGEELPRREPKVPYNGAAGVPIREEVLARHGEDVITRNAYGARCLNSPNALFADVDFDLPFHLGATVATFAALALSGLGIGVAQGSWRLTLGLLGAALVLATPISVLLRSLCVSVQGGVAAVARRRLRRFVTSHPEWNVRVYQTPGGLRLLATHRPYAPDDADVARFFQAVGADPIYVRMCLNQRCFRARLTAKPWRIGIAAHMRPRPGVWPVSVERASLRASWVAAYETRAARYSSCRYLESVGSGAVDPRLRSVIALHDRESRANDLLLTVA